MSTSYFLSPHVHLCVAGKQVVLLDLERDKYLALSQAHPVGRRVRGWPVVASAATERLARATESSARESQAGAGKSPAGVDVAVAQADVEAALETESRLLEKMLGQRLLVTDPAVGKEAVPTVTEPPKVALVEPQLLARPRVTGGQFWNLLRAHVAARWSLKRRPIKEVVQAVRLWKKRGFNAGTMDVDRARMLVAAFLYLRPLFYTAREACLLDSLTLIRYLAGYGVFPDWVFGVKTEPFYAHCWVQQGGRVFNDSPEYLGEFTPILVV